MGEFLKTAMGYFGSASAGSQNEFVGQIVNIGTQKFEITKVIAEGGFALVYRTQDVESGKEYALKRLIGVDKIQCDNILNEIKIHKKLSGHINIVNFEGFSYVEKKLMDNSIRVEYSLLMQICEGSIVDIIKCSINPNIVLEVFFQVTKAVEHLHSQSVPIIHRDIKIENFLLGGDGFLKLCDFGSATTEIFQPNENWSASQRDMLSDQLELVTTPMYRAPEVLDIWSNNVIGPELDIWALGCVIYWLCFQKHPFEDSAKLKIINGNYLIPKEESYACYDKIIKRCLTVDPCKRITSKTLLENLCYISEMKGWPVNKALSFKKLPEITQNNLLKDDSTIKTTESVNQQYSEKTLRQNPKNFNSQYGSLFSSIRGGAENIFKNIKDTSSKVMTTVQHSFGRGGIDISYITSRLLVMPCLSDSIENRLNNLQEVKIILENRFLLSKISIYNLGTFNSLHMPAPVRTVEVSLINPSLGTKSPNIQGLFSLAEDMYGYLQADSERIVILQSLINDHSIPAIVVCALILYTAFSLEPEDSLQIYAVKRHPVNIKPSHLRYLYYLKQIFKPNPYFPHSKIVKIESISYSTLCNITKGIESIKLLLEIYCNDKLEWSNVTDLASLRNDTDQERAIVKIDVCGDVNIIMYIVKNNVKRIGKENVIKICQFQFYTGFVFENKNIINFSSNELDDLLDDNCIPKNFSVQLNYFIKEDHLSSNIIQPWLQTMDLRNPLVLFSSKLEHDEIKDNFVSEIKQIEITTPYKEECMDNVEIQNKPVDTINSVTEDVDLLNLTPLKFEENKRISPISETKNVLFDHIEHLDTPSTLIDYGENANSKIDDILGSYEMAGTENLTLPTNMSPIRDPFDDYMKKMSNSNEDLLGTAKTPIVQTNNKQTVNNCRPDYSRSSFEPVQTKLEPKSGFDIFGDILGEQGYNFGSKSSQAPTSINSMRKEVLSQSMDPDMVKIMNWTDGKKCNIRALLCSMHTVLWDDVKWTKCEMHQLILQVDVKKAYRKACLAVHPDKQAGTKNEKMAKLIFMELNKAWSDFENDTVQQQLAGQTVLK